MKIQGRILAESSSNAYGFLWGRSYFWNTDDGQYLVVHKPGDSDYCAYALYGALLQKI